MDNETKNILKILGVAVVVLFVFKPKFSKKAIGLKSNGASGNLNPPKTEDAISDKDFDNAIVAIKAYRSALNNGESQSALEEINQKALAEFGVKIIQKNGKLFAVDKNGRDIANEK